MSDELMTAAVGHPTVRAALEQYFAESGDVYADPAAFERFIDGGGNVALYREAAGALRELYAQLQPRRALDVGCGEGRLTSALLGPGLEHIDLVEPSAKLLAAAVNRLHDPGSTTTGTFPEAAIEGLGDAGPTVAGTFPDAAIEGLGDAGPTVAAHQMTAQDFVERLTDGDRDGVRSTAPHQAPDREARRPGLPDQATSDVSDPAQSTSQRHTLDPEARRSGSGPAQATSQDHAPEPEDWRSGWDVVQATFALHALEPVARRGVLAALAPRVDRVVVVEFDVPGFVDRSDEHAAYAVERYADGIAEYEGDELVVQGFLMPVLVGQFDPEQPRHTWEQPVEAWVSDLDAAGFRDVKHRRLHDYWWAPAYLIEAQGRLGPVL